MNENNIKFVDNEEKLICELKDEIEDPTLEDSGRIVMVTNKRIYINDDSKTFFSRNIINLDTVNYVEYTSKSEKKYVGIVLGILLILAGIILAIELENIEISFLCIAIGLIFIIVNVALNNKKETVLIIGSNVQPIKINVNEVPIENIEEIQHAIFKAKDEEKHA